MKIYSINMSSGEIQTEDVETDSLNEEKVWSLLQEKSVITPEWWDEIFQSERRREDDRS